MKIFYTLTIILFSNVGLGSDWHYYLYSQGMKGDKVKISKEAIDIKQSHADNFSCLITEVSKYKDMEQRAIACVDLKSENVYKSTVACTPGSTDMGTFEFKIKNKELSIFLQCSGK